MAISQKTVNHPPLCPAIFTFHSKTALPKHEEQENILSNEIKLEKLAEMGMEYIYSPDFNSVRHYTAIDFIEKVLVAILNAKIVVCGFDFRLGKDAGADAEKLKVLCKGYGIDVIIIPPFSLDGKIVHSTAIKQMIKTGDIVGANKLLGFEFCIDAEVIKGRQLGRQLNSPTINQIIPDSTIIPRFGVYKSKTIIDGKEYISVTNIGVKPTVTDSKVVLMETHILDFDDDLYGRVLRVCLLKFVRDEHLFSGIEQLKEQIHSDILACRE